MYISHGLPCLYNTLFDIKHCLTPGIYRTVDKNNHLHRYQVPLVYNEPSNELKSMHYKQFKSYESSFDWCVKHNMKLSDAKLLSTIKCVNLDIDAWLASLHILKRMYFS